MIVGFLEINTITLIYIPKFTVFFCNKFHSFCPFIVRLVHFLSKKQIFSSKKLVFLNIFDEIIFLKYLII